MSIASRRAGRSACFVALTVLSLVVACGRSKDDAHEHPAVDIAKRSSELAPFFGQSAVAFHPTPAGFETERASTTLTAIAPNDATKALVVQPHAGFQIGLRLDGARDARGRVDGQRVVFDRVLPDVDLVVAHDGTRVEELVYIASRQAPSTFDWSLDLPTNARVAIDGGQAIVYEGEAAQARIDEPFVIDARGTRRSAQLALNEGRLRISFDPSGLTYPVVLDPTIAKPTWTKVATGGIPFTRNAAMAFHPGRQTLQLYLPEKEIPQTSPNPDYPPWQRVFDAEHWEWSKAGGYKQLPQPPSLPYSSYPNGSLVYDQNRQRLILAAGSDFFHPLSVYEWNGSSWTSELCGYDVSSGICKDIYSDSNGAAPVGAYHAGRSRPFYFYYNQTFEWGATGPVKIPGAGPPGRRGASMAYDAARGKIVLFGGYQYYSNGSIKYTDTWEFDSSWKKITDAGPGFRMYAAMTYDAARKRVVLHGGYTEQANNPTIYNDTWEWDGTSWTQATVANPPARMDEALAYSPVERKSFLVGGGNSDYNEGITPVLTNELNAYQVYGGSCATTNDCNGDYACSDGMCCTALCGSCQKCDPTTFSCVAVKNGTDDSCNGLNSCDANGVCKKVLGQACTANSECATNNCVDKVCCDSPCNGACDACGASGKCTALGKTETGSPSCAPYLCSGTTGACATSCTDDSNCVATSYCNIPSGSTTGTCVADKAPGASCTTAGQCASGACIDGYCCNSACDGACSACTVAKGSSANGTCTILPKGSNGVPSCSPFLCGGTGKCPTACTGDGDCVAESRCVEGTCIGKKTQGTQCSADSDCATGHCADGVCCDAKCDGQCEACNIDIAVGTCTVIANLPPQGDRPACPPAPEGRPCEQRVCDGKSRASCNGFVGSTVSCGEDSCKTDATKGFTATVAGRCSGDGACKQPDATRCEPFACDATACKTTCSADADCTAGYTCDVASKKCLGGTHCKDEFTEVSTAGKERDCKPFHCSNNRCITDCTTSDDCAAGFFCSGGDGQCKSLDGTGGGGDEGGCSIARTSSRSSSLFVGGLAGLALLTIRRRRRSS